MNEFEMEDDDALRGYEGYDWEDLSDVPPPDALFRVLSHRQRRRVLWFLLERPETTIGELADILVGWELTDDDGDAVGPEKRRRVLVALYHRHLPLLEESGLAAYDAETGAVRFSSPPEPIAVLIKFSYQYERAVAGRGV